MVVTKTEIQTLLNKVQDIENLSFLTPKAFDNLSTEIFKKTKNQISVSTLKRLWGYVNSRSSVRISTLDILSQYVGFYNFNDFQKEQQKNNSSGFLEQETIISSSLKVGSLIEIGWQPNRLCQLIYNGDNQFIIKTAFNTSIDIKSIFKTSIFILSEPLYLENISPTNNDQKIYIAGKKTGLTILKIIDERS